MTEQLLNVAISTLGAFSGAWLALRVELRWIRADLARVERQTDSHSTRLRALELRE